MDRASVASEINSWEKWNLFPVVGGGMCIQNNYHKTFLSMSKENDSGFFSPFLNLFGSSYFTEMRETCSTWELFSFRRTQKVVAIDMSFDLTQALVNENTPAYIAPNIINNRDG